MKKYLLKKYLPKLIAIGIIVFFSLMEGAAGADAILQPRELQQYIRHNDVPFFREIAKLNDKEKALAKAPKPHNSCSGCANICSTSHSSVSAKSERCPCGKNTSSMPPSSASPTRYATISPPSIPTSSRQTPSLAHDSTS